MFTCKSSKPFIFNITNQNYNGYNQQSYTSIQSWLVENKI